MIKGIPEPSADSPTWPHVLRFAKMMEYKLSMNRHKGDRKGWLNADIYALLDLLDKEVEELNGAVEDLCTPVAIVSEAADIANFAMMIADHFSND